MFCHGRVAWISFENLNQTYQISFMNELDNGTYLRNTLDELNSFLDKVIPEYWIQSQFLLNDCHFFKSIKYATLLFVWYMTVKMTQIFWFVKYWLGQTLFSNSVSWCFLNAVNFYHLIKIPFWIILYMSLEISVISSMSFLLDARISISSVFAYISIQQ